MRLKKKIISMFMVMVMITMMNGINYKVYGDNLSVTVEPNAATYDSVRATPQPLTAVTTGGEGSYTYQWYRSGGPNGVKDLIAGATKDSYTPQLESGDVYYFVTVTDKSGKQVTSQPIKVRTAPTAPRAKEISAIVRNKSLSAVIKLSSDYKLGKGFGVLVVKGDEQPTDPGANGLLWNFKMILNEDGKYESDIYLSQLEREVNYKIYTCTYDYYYNDYNPTYSDMVSSFAFTIDKLQNPLEIKGKKVNIKYKKLKKKAKSLDSTKAIDFIQNGEGDLTFTKVSGDKKIAVNKKNGKITVKKGLAKGSYHVKIKVKANGNKDYKESEWKSATVKIKIK